jgi:hypothetical protein
VKRTFLGLLTTMAFLPGLLLAAPAHAATAGQPIRVNEACTLGQRHQFAATKVFHVNECYNTPGGTIIMQADGNLVIYDNDWRALCASNTERFPGANAIFQDDGNFVIYYEGIPVRQSRTNGNGGTVLIFNINAQLLIKYPQGGKIWNLCQDGMFPV